MRSLTFDLAMDFIEDHIINNSLIPEDLKLRLLYSSDMAPYSFLGALYHLAFASASDIAPSEDNQFDKEEEEAEEDIEVEELLDIYHKLTQSDVKIIVKSQGAMEKVELIRAEVGKSKKINKEH